MTSHTAILTSTQVQLKPEIHGPAPSLDERSTRGDSVLLMLQNEAAYSDRTMYLPDSHAVYVYTDHYGLYTLKQEVDL